MALTRINQNISSLNAQRNLEINTNRISQSIERLSSGFRINRGADDPAGLVMSEILRVQVSGLDVAQQNALQGVNLIKTAEGALNEVTTLLRQVRDLAVSAASDSNLNDDARSALQSQVSSALGTINTIANNTAYAGVKLLDGSAGTASEIADLTHIQAASLTGLTTSGWVNVKTPTTKAEQAVADTEAVGGGMSTASKFSDIDANWTNDGTTTLYINGTQINATDSYTKDTTMATVIQDVNAKSSTTGVKARINATTNKLELYTEAYGAGTYVAAEFVHGATAPDSFKILDATGSLFESDTGASAVVPVALPGVTGDQTFTGGNTTGKVVANSTYGSITLTDAGNDTGWGGNTHAVYVTAGQLSFQVGVDAGQTASTTIPSIKTSELGASTGTALADIDISSPAGAGDALTVIDQAINDVSTLRGDLGAFQVNSLEAQGRSLAVSRENLAASEATIRDTDFGREMAEFTTSQILVQSAIAFLAQANTLPQNVLTLIRG